MPKSDDEVVPDFAADPPAREGCAFSGSPPRAAVSPDPALSRGARAAAGSGSRAHG